MDNILYELQLHQSVDSMQGFQILRVAGGWVYIFPENSVFVPFNNEFQSIPESAYLPKSEDLPY